MYDYNIPLDWALRPHQRRRACRYAGIDALISWPVVPGQPATVILLHDDFCSVYVAYYPRVVVPFAAVLQHATYLDSNGVNGTITITLSSP